MTARPATPGRWVFSSRADGDLAIAAPEVAEARAALSARAGAPATPWNWLRQVHGPRVVVAERAGQHEGTEADALVTAKPLVPIAVQTADCGAVVFESPEGVVGVAHAGWRGLADGVLGATVEAMQDLGATRVSAHLGPMIHPECYEFGAEDLAAVCAALDADVAGRTAAGAPALDLPRAVAGAVEAAGASVTSGSPGCTACRADLWYSHRARQEVGRMAALVWAAA